MSPCFCSTAAMLPKCKTELKCWHRVHSRDTLLAPQWISEQPANRLAAEDWPWARGFGPCWNRQGFELWSRYWEEKRTRRVWSKYVEVWREIQTMPIFQAVRSPHTNTGTVVRVGRLRLYFLRYNGCPGPGSTNLATKKATEQGDPMSRIAISGSETRIRVGSLRSMFEWKVLTVWSSSGGNRHVRVMRWMGVDVGAGIQGVRERD
ncbi:hypothetical protein BDZ89DRAFT_1049566 [Hymenopellis radicata]|nr:hypothetical protein BDZ89DRAFT_1049566 [Hymenopellis radicata]